MRDVVLVEPEMNTIIQRFGLSVIPNYPPLAQVRLAGQIEGGGVEIRDLSRNGVIINGDRVVEGYQLPPDAERVTLQLGDPAVAPNNGVCHGRSPPNVMLS